MNNEIRTYIVSVPVNFTGEPDRIHYERIEVSEEVYNTYYRPIWRARDHAKRHGGCSCADWRKCDGDCGLCRYRTGSDTLSLEKMHEDAGDAIDEDCDPLGEAFVDHIVDEITRSDLAERIQKLDPLSRQICEHLIAGINERDAAASLGLSKTTYHDRKVRLIKELQIDWADLL